MTCISPFLFGIYFRLRENINKILYNPINILSINILFNQMYKTILLFVILYFRNMDVLKKDEWTSNVTKELRTFEKSLITALKQKGNRSFADVHIFYTYHVLN